MKLSLSRLVHVLSFSAIAGAFVACSADGDSTVAAPETPDSSVSSGDASTPSAPDAGSDAAPATTCGNKKVDQGEACDDGNTASGDGCSATCAVETGGPEDLCSGVAVALAKADASTLYKGHVAGNTTGLFNHYSSACGGGSGSDAVYRIDPPMTGRSTVKLTAGFPAIASVRTACDDAKTELACSDGDTLAFPVFAGKPVFVIVDGYGGQNGEFTLDIDVETAICGNGTAEFPETCDDANTTSGDGCSATCTMEDVASTSACPGMGYRLQPGTVSFAGDTSTLANGGGSALACQFSGAADNATYAITPTVTGNLALSLLANYPEALLHIRRSCPENETQADCIGAADALVPMTTNIPVFAEQTVYVFVDGNASSDPGGLFTLNATLTASSCGNGKVDGGEECDDGATAAGDGCSATCTIERDPATYACPGKALRLESAVPGPRSLKVRGTTARASGESVPTSKWSSCGSTSGNDVVYAITSDIDGYLTAKVKGDFNTALAIRSSCLTTGSDLACVKAAGGNGQEVLKAAVNKETTYYVIVDAATANSSGAFELDLEVTPSICGNFVTEGGETCDDGATDNGDGCDTTCKLETEKARDVCGDAAPAITLEPVGATGKYGANLVSGTTNLTKPGTASSAVFTGCSSTKPDAWFNITAPITGVLTARIDSATFWPTIGLRTACAPSGSQLTCNTATSFGGQEIVYPVTQGVTYRFGVSGHNSSVPAVGRFTASFELVPSGCGDTLLNSTEQCEDGNTMNGDGCSATCTVEPLAGINACPGHAIALTGAGAAPRRAVFTVDTTSLPSNTGGACGGSGPEGIVALTSDVDGTLAVTTAASHSVILHARTTCAAPATELTRSSCTSGGPLSSLNAAIKKNTPYYLFVDGINGASGVSKLSITVTP